jgi:hypothetical protein
MSWIDEESNEDNQTKFQEFVSKLFKTRTYAEHGWAYSWYWIIGILEDDEADEIKNPSAYSKTYAKEQLEKRLKREE